MGILLVYDVTDESSFNSNYLQFDWFILFLVQLTISSISSPFIIL